MRIFALLLCMFVPACVLAQDKPTPRLLVALFDSREESTARPSQTHRYLEMPANHLGYIIHYADINAPLPALGDDVAGVVVWLDVGDEVPDAGAYLSWLESAVAKGKKIIILENAGIGEKLLKDKNMARRWNAILNYIGIDDEDYWIQVTYHTGIEYKDDMAGFERAIGPVLPSFPALRVIPHRATSHLRLHVSKEDGEGESFDLLITGPHGGYVAPGYVIYEIETKTEADITQPDPMSFWFINPFKFLKESLDSGLSPVPDVTTLDGRRIFYSHIDGDGWNNVSEIPRYRKRNALSSEVIYEEILKPYDDFGFNVALIVADIDPGCYGVRDSERIARNIFALPNVEPSSHTYSHPLFWEFFEHYDAASEKPFLPLYPQRPKDKFSVVEAIKSSFSKDDWQKNAFSSSVDASSARADVAGGKRIKRGKNESPLEEVFKKDYVTPRSYACSPFDLKQEITGSIDRINALSPKGKRARLIQWSGNTSPFEAALAMTRKAGLLNINGGDSRFDNEYPSYSNVAPIGLYVGKEQQIYSSNSNEDTYTNLWMERFFGYRYLQATVKNTESPIRLSPFNIYFHMFSGEKQASLDAIKSNFAFARTQDVIPLTASGYAAIAEGFYTTRITPLRQNSWRVTDRGDLQTLRFDHATGLSVDFASSRGVLGQHYFQKNLYVALDPSRTDAIVTLKKNAADTILPQEHSPYLISSRWQVKNLEISAHGNSWSFTASGYGEGAMLWKVPAKGDYRVSASAPNGAKAAYAEKHVTASQDGTLSITLEKVSGATPIIIKVSAL